MTDKVFIPLGKGRYLATAAEIVELIRVAVWRSPPVQAAVGESVEQPTFSKPTRVISPYQRLSKSIIKSIFSQLWLCARIASRGGNYDASSEQRQDIHRQGVLRKKDFFLALERVLKISVPWTERDLVFKLIDRNKTNAIEFEDFCQTFEKSSGFTQSSKRRLKEKLGIICNLLFERHLTLRDIFGMSDHLSLAEFAKALQRLNIGMTQQDIYDLMRCIDQDLDRRIQYTEFRDYFKRVYTQYVRHQKGTSKRKVSGRRTSENLPGPFTSLLQNSISNSPPGTSRAEFQIAIQSKLSNPLLPEAFARVSPKDSTSQITSSSSDRRQPERPKSAGKRANRRHPTVARLWRGPVFGLVSWKADTVVFVLEFSESMKAAMRIAEIDTDRATFMVAELKTLFARQLIPRALAGNPIKVNLVAFNDTEIVIWQQKPQELNSDTLGMIEKFCDDMLESLSQRSMKRNRDDSTSKRVGQATSLLKKRDENKERKPIITAALAAAMKHSGSRQCQLATYLLTATSEGSSPALLTSPSQHHQTSNHKGKCSNLDSFDLETFTRDLKLSLRNLQPITVCAIGPFPKAEGSDDSLQTLVRQSKGQYRWTDDTGDAIVLKHEWTAFQADWVKYVTTKVSKLNGCDKNTIKHWRSFSKCQAKKQRRKKLKKQGKRTRKKKSLDCSPLFHQGDIAWQHSVFSLLCTTFSTLSTSLDALFNVFDLNKDGLVSFYEFVNVVKKLLENTSGLLNPGDSLSPVQQRLLWRCLSPMGATTLTRSQFKQSFTALFTLFEIDVPVPYTGKGIKSSEQVNSMEECLSEGSNIDWLPDDLSSIDSLQHPEKNCSSPCEEGKDGLVSTRCGSPDPEVVASEEKQSVLIDNGNSTSGALEGSMISPPIEKAAEQDANIDKTLGADTCNSQSEDSKDLNIVGPADILVLNEVNTNFGDGSEPIPDSKQNVESKGNKSSELARNATGETMSNGEKHAAVTEGSSFENFLDANTKWIAGNCIPGPALENSPELGDEDNSFCHKNTENQELPSQCSNQKMQIDQTRDVVPILSLFPDAPLEPTPDVEVNSHAEIVKQLAQCQPEDTSFQRFSMEVESAGISRETIENLTVGWNPKSRKGLWIEFCLKRNEQRSSLDGASLAATAAAVDLWCQLGENEGGNSQYKLVLDSFLDKSIHERVLGMLRKDDKLNPSCLSRTACCASFHVEAMKAWLKENQLEELDIPEMWGASQSSVRNVKAICTQDVTFDHPCHGSLRPSTSFAALTRMSRWNGRIVSFGSSPNQQRYYVIDSAIGARTGRLACEAPESQGDLAESHNPPDHDSFGFFIRIVAVKSTLEPHSKAKWVQLHPRHLRKGNRELHVLLHKGELVSDGCSIRTGTSCPVPARLYCGANLSKFHAGLFECIVDFSSRECGVSKSEISSDSVVGQACAVYQGVRIQQTEDDGTMTDDTEDESRLLSLSATSSRDSRCGASISFLILTICSQSKLMEIWISTSSSSMEEIVEECQVHIGSTQSEGRVYLSSAVLPKLQVDTGFRPNSLVAGLFHREQLILNESGIRIRKYAAGCWDGDDQSCYASNVESKDFEKDICTSKHSSESSQDLQAGTAAKDCTASAQQQNTEGSHIDANMDPNGNLRGAQKGDASGVADAEHQIEQDWDTQLRQCSGVTILIVEDGNIRDSTSISKSNWLGVGSRKAPLDANQKLHEDSRIRDLPETATTSECLAILRQVVLRKLKQEDVDEKGLENCARELFDNLIGKVNQNYMEISGFDSQPEAVLLRTSYEKTGATVGVISKSTFGIFICGLLGFNLSWCHLNPVFQALSERNSSDLITRNSFTRALFHQCRIPSSRVSQESARMVLCQCRCDILQVALQMLKDDKPLHQHFPNHPMTILTFLRWLEGYGLRLERTVQTNLITLLDPMFSRTILPHSLMMMFTTVFIWVFQTLYSPDQSDPDLEAAKEKIWPSRIRTTIRWLLETVADEEYESLAEQWRTSELIWKLEESKRQVQLLKYQTSQDLQLCKVNGSKRTELLRTQRACLTRLGRIEHQLARIQVSGNSTPKKGSPFPAGSRKVTFGEVWEVNSRWKHVSLPNSLGNGVDNIEHFQCECMTGECAVEVLKQL